MPSRLTVDRSEEIFGAPTTIADLAKNSFPHLDSDKVHIYEVWQVLETDWRDELDRSASTMEYTMGVSAKFHDGSILHIGAWADCCDGSGCKYCGKQ